MKLKFKFILLFLFLSVTVFIAVQLNQLHFKKDYERIAFETIKKNVDLYVEHEEQELNYLLDNYSDMPELTMAIKQNKNTKPIILPFVKNSDISIVWLFDNNQKLISSVSDLPHYKINTSDICPKSFYEIGRGKKCLYHISKGYGFVEIQGIKLRNSVYSDKGVLEEDYGYLFLGRCFDESFIHDFEKFVGSKLIVSNSNKKVIDATYSKPFFDNNHNPIGGISIFSNGDSLDLILKEEYRTSYYILGIIFIYIICYIFIFSNWVIKPLSLLINSLKKDDKTGIIKLSKADNEIGKLAMVVIENSENNKRLKDSFEEIKIFEKELQLFRFTMDKAQDSISWVDIDGRIIQVNDTYCKEIGVSREEAVGSYFWDKNEMVKQEEWNGYWNSMKFLGSYTKDYCQQCCNANELVYFENNSVYIDFKGKEYIVNYRKDVTERKKAEKKLEKVLQDFENKNSELNLLNSNLAVEIIERMHAVDAMKESEEKFKSIFEQSGDGMLLIDNYKIIDCNNSAIKLFGFSEKNDLLNKSLQDFSPEFQENGKSSISESAIHFISANRKGYDNFEWLHKTSTNKIITVEVTLTSIPIFGKKVLFAVMRDITEKKNVVATLRASEEKYRTLINTSPDGITITDLEGKVVYISINSCKMFGYDDPKEVENKKMFDFIHPDDLERVQDTLVDMFNGVFRGIGEYRGIRKDGSEFFFEANGEFLRNSDGIPTEIFYISRDITHRKQTEQDLINAKIKAEESNIAKSEFFANISHEVRTPLNAILGFSEVLMAKLHNSPEYLDYLNGIAISGKNLLNIINDILDLSKIEAGKFEIHNHLVNLRSVFSEVKHIFSLKTTEKNLDFIIEIDKDLPKLIVIDEIRLRQLLFNFVGNAVKFTHKGFIKITAKGIENANPEKIGLQIEVEDSGIGIDKSQFELIFKPFLQHERQNDRKYGGTGLGLTIAKRLIEMMNGEISVESTLGLGSKFNIRFRDIEISNENEIDIIGGSVHIYSERQKTSNLIDDDEFNNFSKKLLKELRSKVIEEIFPSFLIAKKTMSITKILDLANLLIEVGEKLKVKFILNYGNELLQGANNFRVGKIISILEQLELDLAKIIK
ncbi:MAG: PAS domain S-box protein [Bacteroidetes bacterium]|nr:PAS domain S-box protein [Bacteroidota bacterium]